jgi:hypothetical protein
MRPNEVLKNLPHLLILCKEKHYSFVLAKTILRDPQCASQSLHGKLGGGTYAVILMKYMTFQIKVFPSAFFYAKIGQCLSKKTRP